ncbi:General transcription factor 3C polypeptide 4 [Nymphon striatum]|nr:General transcription factor 3C polypeptide 4 [Nymphon striatum]
MAVKAVRMMSVAGEICHSPAISWSSDNRIALSIDDGIHVLEPVLNGTDPAPFNCIRTFIPTPLAPVNFDVGCNREEIMKNLDRDILTKLMLDPTLCPEAPFAIKNKGYCAGIWSPSCLTSNHKCILASLSMGHKLVLHRETDGHWDEIDDLSFKFFGIAQLNKFLACDSDHIDLSNLDAPGQDYFMLKSRMYFLSAIEIVWTQCFTNECQDFAFLIAAMKSGHLVFWRVNLPCNSSDDVAIETVQDTSLGIITCLTWYQTSKNSGLLVIGSHIGNVQILPVSIHEHSLTVGSALMVWDDDDSIAVRCIAVNGQQHGNCVIVCGKGHYIVSSLVSSKGELIRQAVSEGIHSLPLSNICSLINGWFLACSSDSNIYKFQVDCFGEDITLMEEIVEFDIQTKKMMPYGIIQSPNAIFCCLVQRMACMFDHLAYREPIRINFFINQEEDVIWTNLITYDKQFSECKDIQEFIRVRLNFEDALPKLITDILESNESCLRQQSIFVLKLVRFIFSKQISSISSEVEAEDKSTNQKEGDCKKLAFTFQIKILDMDISINVSDIILHKHVMFVMKNVYGTNAYKKLSPKKLLSLLVMTEYVLSDNTTISLSDEDKDIAEDISSKVRCRLSISEQEEGCAICHEDIL